LTENVLVIGAGFLGGNIIQEFKNNNIIVIGTTNTDSLYIKLDITSYNDVKEICTKFNPDLIVNCAANNDVEKLEKNPDLAYQINTKGVENIAKIAEEINSRLFHISTDSVFDGLSKMYKENDLPNPINHYSKSKYFAEKAISENCSNHIIIRTNFYGHNKKSNYLFNSILNKLFNNETFIGFDDVLFNPLEVSNLSVMIHELSKTNFKGILHLSSDTVLSKYHFCVKIAEAFNFDKNLIKLGSIDDMNFTALRPKNTSLDNSKSKSLLKTQINSMDDWLFSIKNTLL